MRNKIQQQLLIVYPFIAHEHARELRRISDILDQIPEACALVYDDLIAHGPSVSTGRPGLTGAQALRVLLLKQMNGFSYEELAFHLADSRCYRAFCSFGIDEKAPRKSALQQNIKGASGFRVGSIAFSLLIMTLRCRPGKDPNLLGGT